MHHFQRFFVVLALVLVTSAGLRAEERAISHQQLIDKLSGFWNGQLLGNFIGFPFENNYVDEPVPLFVDQVYAATYDGDPPLKLNRKDLRGHVPILCHALKGAFSDDDTDIEFVTLHAVEKYGLHITYPEITQMWKAHINDYIWVANRRARGLMEKGMIAPETGKKENNRDWFQIDPQLVNEIWSAFYPGMTERAAERALWGARITNDDWGTHPTIAYGAMISAAFFESDVERLVQIGIEAVPEEGPFAEGIRDVVRWHKENEQWRDTRKLIHEKYYAYNNGTYQAPVSVVSSLQNGLCGIMAILYGRGDYMRTVGIATSAGYDCDNQAATCGGLVGLLNGFSGMGEAAHHIMLNIPSRGSWEEPFNNRYVNTTRDGLPFRTPISEIVDRIAKVARDAILENGGREEMRDGELTYIINCDF